MKKLTSIKAFIIASYLLSSAVPARANAAVAADAGASIITSHVIPAMRGTAVAAFAASLFRFFSRNPDNKPNRYDIEQLKNLNLPYIWNNKLNIIDDGLIGHAKKSASIAIAPKEDGSTGLELVVNKEKVDARGVYGWCSEMAKPVGSTLAFLGACIATSALWEIGSDNWQAFFDGTLDFKGLVEAAKKTALAKAAGK